MDGGVSTRLLEILAEDPARRRQASEEMLQQLLERNPNLAPLTGLLARNLSEEGSDAAGVLTGEVDEEIDELRARCDSLLEELGVLRRLLSTLASALGACESCWGTDAGCPNCGGDGRSGSFLPHRDLFHEWIVPAIRRLPQRRPRAGPRLPVTHEAVREQGGRA